MRITQRADGLVFETWKQRHKGTMSLAFVHSALKEQEPGFKSWSLKLTPKSAHRCSTLLTTCAQPVSVSAGLTVSELSVVFLPLLIGHSSGFLKNVLLIC